MFSPYFLVDCVAVLLALWVIRKAFSGSSTSRHYPPGPKGLPIVGNLFDVPTSQEWQTYSQWADRWGDLISMNVLGQRIAIISSVRVAFDLFEKRSVIYSDRPHLVVAGETVGHANTIPMAPYGERMRKIRRMFTKAVGTKALMEDFMPLMSETIQDYLMHLLKKPQDFRDHIRLMTSTNILLISHGHRVKDSNDRFLKLSDAVTDEFSEAVAPGAFLVDQFPLLRHLPSWVPGTAWRKTAEKYRRHVTDAVAEPFAFVKQQMAAGTAIPSFVSRNLDDGAAPSPDHEHTVKYAAMALYTAGSDTTASALTSLFLAMTLYPEVQRRAQAELDGVVGTDRLPTFEDRDRLPYINAICSEVLRWMPVGPLGLPHRLTEDDVYEGYALPKGTIFFVNNWKLLHDPDTYRDPMAFMPERFLGAAPELDPSKIAFGYGRRICPGILVAEATIFITVAATLAAFSIRPAQNGGAPSLPPVRQTSGIISHPAPFQCDVVPRSKKAEALVVAAVENR